jgi:hypothetical protein
VLARISHIVVNGCEKCGHALRIETAAFRQSFGASTGAASGPRSKRVSSLTEWRSTRRRAAISIAGKGLVTRPASCAGQQRSIRWPATRLMLTHVRAKRIHFAGTCAMGSANKDRLVPSLRRKRSRFAQEVRFHPLPTMRTQL